MEVEREALGRPSWSSLPWPRRLENHVERLARHSLQQAACSSQSNVRRIKAGVSIEELAEDIARRTLLQSITVRPVLDDAGDETGMFEIPAGGRRYRALELLVKQKRLARTAPIPCVVRTEGTPRRTVSPRTSSARRCIRSTSSAPFWRCAKRARARKRSPLLSSSASTWSSSGCGSPSVSPKLLDIYAEDGMTLDQLMAFTVSPDHERQEQVSGGDPALLQEGALSNPPASDRGRRARLATSGRNMSGEDYVAAGGGVMRDLFQSDDGGWLQDVGSARPSRRRKARTRSASRCAPRAGNGSRSRPISLTATPTAFAMSAANASL